MSKGFKKTALFLFTALSVFISELVFADMVYLDNGEKIEGIIRAENSSNLTLDIGSGTIILRRAEIDHIDYYDRQAQDTLTGEWRRKYFERLDFVPGNFKRLFGELKVIETMRSEAIASSKEKEIASGRINKLDRILSDLGVNLAQVSKSLIATDPQKDAKKYNSLVEDFNSSQAKVKLNEYERSLLIKKLSRLDERIFGYIDKLSLFQENFEKESNNLEHSSPDDKELVMLIDSKLNVLADDFKKYSIGYNRKGDAIIVEALLNEITKVNFILDTGASIVVISRRIANKLGLNIDDKNLSTFVTLADGRKVRANAVLLDSISIGNLKAKNIQAAVLEKEEAISEDGLLGMSFLKNFTIKIDPKNGKLVLEEFKP